MNLHESDDRESGDTLGAAQPETPVERARREGFIDPAARGEYLRLAVGCFLSSFMLSHSTLLVVVFKRDGYSLHDIGLLLSLIAIPVIAFALMSGEIAARIGTLGTLRLAMVLNILGFASLLLTHGSFWPALGSRLVQGAGQGLFLASALTYAQSRLSPAKFLFLLGIFSATMPFANAVAPPFGGFVLNTWGVNVFFFLASIPAFVGLALTYGVRPLEKPPRRDGLELLQSFRPGAAEPLLGVFVNGMMMGFCTAYLAAAMEAKAIPLAAFFTASTVTMFASRILALRSIESADRRILVAAGLSLMAIGFVAVAAAGFSPWPVMFGGVCFGFGYSLTYPVLAAWISEGVAPAARAGPQALLNGFFNFGLYATPLPETFIVARFGYEAAMIVLAALSFATAGLLVVQSFRERAV